MTAFVTQQIQTETDALLLLYFRIFRNGILQRTEILNSSRFFVTLSANFFAIIKLYLSRRTIWLKFLSLSFL